MPFRYELKDLVEMIDEPNRSRCRRLLKDNLGLFKRSYGSTHNHQNWPGGYYDHITEVMNIAVALFKGLGAYRPLPFFLSDALLVLFFHDIEKPWKYVTGRNGELRHSRRFKTEADQHRFQAKKLEEYGIELSDQQGNALRYVHGELDEYSSKRRVMGPLGAFCHMCDVWSARGWFNHPGDPWPGAKKVSERR